MRYGAWVWLLLAAASICRGTGDWQLPEWRYRVPVQVSNLTGTPKSGLLLALRDLPTTSLLNDGKIAADGSDFRLLDSRGAELPIRPEWLESDSGDAQVAFFLKDLRPKGKARLWLYYGNPAAKAGAALREDEQPPVLTPETLVTFGTEEAKTPDPAPQPGNLGKFLANLQPREFESQKALGFQPAQLAPALRNSVSGASYLAADGSPDKSVSLDFDAPAGAVICWVRYSPSPNAKTAPAGSLTFALTQDDKPLARQAVSFAKNDEDEPNPDDMGPGDDMEPDTLLRAEEELTRERTAFRWIPLRATVKQGKVTLTVTSEKSRATLDCAVLTANAKYAPDIRDFVGRVWVRWRIDAPAEFRHTAYVNSQIYYDFKGAHWQPTGNVTAYGLFTDDNTPIDDTDALPAGSYSPWVLLPTSGFYTWFTIISCKARGGTQFTGGTATLEFANRPAASHVFHITAGEPLDLDGSLFLRMPTQTTIAGLNGLETFHEWSLRRLAMLKELNLGPAPRLKRLRIGTWAGLWARVPKDWLDIDYQIFEGLGINMAAAPEDIFPQLAKAHGIIDTNTIAWGPVDEYKKIYPFASSITTRFNMGDEPGPSIEPKDIEADPAKLEDFRSWLKEQKLTPQMLGATKWEDVYPTEDRRFVGGPKPPPPPMVKQEDIDDPLPTAPDEPGDALNVFKGEKEERPGPKWETIEAGRLFYYTRRYIDVYSAREWRKGTDNVLKFFPNARLISPNYQAGPMQIAFLGNNNDTYRGMIDIFMYTRTHALKGVGMEDWVGGWDGGVNAICFASEMIRSACRKDHETMSSLLVGGSIRSKLYGFLMHGLKDNDLYLYGPLNNIGPPWGENPNSYRELGEASREIKKFEDPIADGDVRPRKSAILVAYTSEIMQKKGCYFCGLRQQTYAGLKHSYTQADVVCEQEILEDNILKNYDQLFITDSNAPIAVQGKIAEWVKNGGKLWACAGALEWDEFQQYCPVLDPVFGVKHREMVAGKPTTITADSPLFGGKVEMATTDQLMTAEAAGAQVIGAYADDGKPAIFYNKYGKGEALLVGALVGNAYWNAHYAKDSIKTPGGTYENGAEAQRILNAFTAPADRPVVCSVPGIVTSVFDCPQGAVVFLNNATYSGQALDPDRPAPRVTARVKVDGPVTSVESAKFGKLEYQLKDSELTFTLAVPNADIIMIRK